jgi:hypothetical protein
MKLFFASIFCLAIASCSSNADSRWDVIIFESLQKMEANKVLVDIEIDGKKFYASNDPLEARSILNELSCTLDFKNQQNGTISFRMEGADWSSLSEKTIVFKNGVSTSDSISSTFLIGRKLNKIAEGYTMKDGSFEIRQLNQEACIIVVQGMLEDPLDKRITKPINGLIVWKKPIDFPTNSEKKVFYF